LVLTCGRTSGIFTWYKEFPIEASENSASGVKVWILTTMVGLLMAAVSFFAVRIINTVDETEASVHTMKEVQASQGEVIKGLQRDRDNADKEIERLRNQVDRLKDDNAILKAKAGIPLTLNSEPPSGGFFHLVILVTVWWPFFSPHYERTHVNKRGLNVRRTDIWYRSCFGRSCWCECLWISNRH
jgi:hypothetical protein